MGSSKSTVKTPSVTREERLRDGYHGAILTHIAKSIASDLKHHPCYAHLCDDEEETFTVNQVLTAADETIGTVLEYVIDNRDSGRTDYQWRKILEIEVPKDDLNSGISPIEAASTSEPVGAFL